MKKTEDTSESSATTAGLPTSNMEHLLLLQENQQQYQSADTPKSNLVAVASAAASCHSSESSPSDDHANVDNRTIIFQLPQDMQHHVLTFLRVDSVAAFHRCARLTVNIFRMLRSLRFKPTPSVFLHENDNGFAELMSEMPCPRGNTFLLSSLPTLARSTLARHLDHVSFDNTILKADRSDIEKVRATIKAHSEFFALLSPITQPNMSANMVALPYLRSLHYPTHVTHHLNWRFPHQLRQLNLRLHLHDFVMTACFTGEEHEDHFVHFFDCLQYLTQLEVLSLAWFDHSTNGESTFNLKKKFAAPSIRPLMKLQTLRSLELGTSNLLPDAILVASSLPRLTTFLTPSATQVDLIAFSLTPIAARIEQLDIATSEMKNLPSQILTRFTSLTRLDLPCDYECTDYDFLFDLSQLRTMRFSYGEFNRGLLPSPEVIRSLTHLTLSWEYSTPSHIRVFELLIECVHLTHLSVRLNRTTESMNTDRLTQLLVSLPRLQSASFTSYFNQASEHLRHERSDFVDEEPMDHRDRTFREIAYNKRMQTREESTAAATAGALPVSSTLRSLTISCYFYPSWISRTRLFSSLPALECLTLAQVSYSRNMKYFSEAKSMDEQKLPSLTYLRLVTAGTQDDFSSIDFDALCSSQAFPRLQHLVLDGLRSKERKNIVKNVLPKMQQLRTFEMRMCRYADNYHTHATEPPTFMHFNRNNA